MVRERKTGGEGEKEKERKDKSKERAEWVVKEVFATQLCLRVK
jgi:hypothetical protein